MNTATKLILTVATLGVGTGVYIYLQPAASTTGGGAAVLRPSTRLLNTTGGSRLGPGERPWANQYGETGELSYQFRAKDYEPIDAGTVRVTEPSFRFFLSDGRVVELTGQTGQVYLPRSAGGGPSVLGGGGAAGASKGPMGLPTRGVMKTVEIKLYDAPTDLATPENPTDRSVLTATMDNVAFDNDTLRIATESFNDGTRDVPADKVPVIVRGRDADFDGEGLSVRINQRDRTIQSLEVARGTRLVIKNPGSFDADFGTPAAARPTAAAPATSAAPTAAPNAAGTPAVPAPVASADPKLPAPVPTSRPARPDVVYRATFKNQVLIQQGKAAAATGDALQIDFNTGPRTPTADRTAATRPATAPPPAPSVALREGTTPAAPAQSPPPQLAPALTPATAPTNAPTQEPVVLTWDGPLRVVADAGDPKTPPRAATALLLGNAEKGILTELRQAGSLARAPSVRFETRGEAGHKIATLLGTDSLPVTLQDDRGSVVTTPELRYDLDGREVRMRGATVVRAQVDTDAAGKPRTMLASWSKDAVLHFAKTKDQRIETAVLTGDVRVEHPELDLKSGRLALDFDTSAPRAKTKKGTAESGVAVAGVGGQLVTGGAPLRQALATGGVEAVVIEADKPGQSKPSNAGKSGLKADTLRLTTTRDDRGRLYPDRVESTGNVLATDGKQLLETDHLVVTLAPDRKPLPNAAAPDDATPNDAAAGAIGGGMSQSKAQTLTATGHVRATADDGSVATASTMEVRDVSGKPDVLLLGTAQEPAAVRGKDAGVSAGRIRYTQADGRALIDGPGTLNGVQRAEKPGEPDSPFTASWTGSALFDDAANRVDVKDNVRFETRGRDGAFNTATAKALTVFLAPSKPPANPATPDKTAAADKAKGQTALLGQKDLKGIELNGTVQLQQVLGDASGQLLRQFTLLTERVQYEQGGAFVTPGPGRLLLVDRRSADAVKAKPNDPMPSGRGVTAIQWVKSLSYLPAERELAFEGAVRFRHQPNSDPAGGTATGPVGAPPEPPMSLDADRLVAKLAPAAPAKGQQDPTYLETGQLEKVTATGDLQFVGRGFTLNADNLDFDPAAQIVTIFADGRKQVRVDNERGTGSGTFDRARINLKTGQVEDLVNPTGSVGAGALTPPASPTPPATPSNATPPPPAPSTPPTTKPAARPTPKPSGVVPRPGKT